MQKRDAGEETASGLSHSLCEGELAVLGEVDEQKDWLSLVVLLQVGREDDSAPHLVPSHTAKVRVTLACGIHFTCSLVTLACGIHFTCSLVILACGIHFTCSLVILACGIHFTCSLVILFFFLLLFFEFLLLLTFFNTSLLQTYIHGALEDMRHWYSQHFMSHKHGMNEQTGKREVDESISLQEKVCNAPTWRRNLNMSSYYSLAILACGINFTCSLVTLACGIHFISSLVTLVCGMHFTCSLVTMACGQHFTCSLVTMVRGIHLACSQVRF